MPETKKQKAIRTFVQDVLKINATSGFQTILEKQGYYYCTINQCVVYGGPKRRNSFARNRGPVGIGE